MDEGNQDEPAAEPANATIQQQQQQDWQHQQIRQLLDMMSPEQQARYDIYRSTAFPKNQFRKLLSNILGQSASERMSAVVAGVCKLHVGQLVEEARRVMQQEHFESSPSGNARSDGNLSDSTELPPIRPHHLREAARRLSHKPNKRSLLNSC